MNKLYLIPSTLGDTPADHVIPEHVIRIINGTDIYIVENERSARRFLIKAGLKKPVDQVTFFELNKHTKTEEAEVFFQSVTTEDIGIISEAGVPCIADPGAAIVSLAHKRGRKVVPLVGPSSVLMAMMASGLNGQNFAFNGYLPVKQHERINRIKELENRSYREKQAQLFIEAPYRNNQLLNDILDTCQGETLLCIAVDISLETEMIETRPVKLWKTKKPELHKRPAIFIIQKP
ncbi:MAG: SAM-dependent methyltransferase [Bacteroidales bacterium]|nr:SAM-dependent methyltransferase [Bacteroidales bacterium]